MHGCIAPDAQDEQGPTEMHCNVAADATALARLAGLPEEQCIMIGVASRLRDIGMRDIAPEIVEKPGHLSFLERREMQRHTLIGYRKLTSRRGQLFHLAANIAIAHHEHYDGTGYPHGISGERIPAAARIVAIVDTYHALRSWRPWRDPLSIRETYLLMAAESGRRFDPVLLDLFLSSVVPSALARRAASRGV